MAGSRTLKLNILADTKGLVDGLNKANNQVEGASGKIGLAFKKIGVAVAAAGVAAGAFAVKLGVDAVKAASDLNETVAKAGEIFGSSSKQVEAFAANAASSLGQSKQQAIDAATTFAVFGKSAGLAGSDLVKFSTDFTVLASDLASFNNTTPDEAITAIGAALRGEAEPLRRFGVLLDDASLRAAALELGIISTTKNALTPQQKVLAAQALIYKQTGDAQGDFLRTSDGLANSQRILTAQIENVKTSIGTALLPVATELFQFIGSKLIPLMTKFSESFSREAGPAIDNMRKVVTDFVLPALKNLWSFITEFVVPTVRNLLTPVIEVLQAAFVFLSNKIKENREGLDTFIVIALKLAGFVRDTVAPILGGILATAFNLVVRAVGQAIDNFSKVFEIIGKVARFFGMDFDTEVTKATKTVNNLNTGTVDAYKSFAEQSRTIVKDVIPSIGSLTTSTNGLASSNNALAGSTRAVTAAMKEQFTAAQAIDLIRSGFGSEVGVTGPGTLAGGESVRSAAEIVSQFGGFIKGFNFAPTDPYFGFGKGSNIRTFQQGQGAVQAGNVVINVNGTVIDPEGAARAIASVISNSVARVGSLPFVPALAFE
jgi:hypothetical protein